mgnify:CR=1 FL=1
MDTHAHFDDAPELAEGSGPLFARRRSDAGEEEDAAGEPLLFTDPWITGSCYWRSWWLQNYPSDELLSELKPDAVVTWGPDGVTGHTDHRMISNIVTEFTKFARLPPPAPAPMKLLETARSVVVLHSSGGTQVTVRDLFAHRSGLPGNAGNELEQIGYSRPQILAPPLGGGQAPPPPGLSRRCRAG